MLGVPEVDVNLADKDGSTPLSTTCGRYHTKMMMVLLGASLHRRPILITPRWWSCCWVPRGST